MQLRVGQLAPDFTLASHLDQQITLRDLRGKNVVLVFFPLAWTPIWTSQIPSYEADYAKFAGLNAQVLSISVDHIPCLKAWAESLGGINYPLLSDFWPHGAVSERYGVFRSDGRSERAIFVIDKYGIIRYIDIHDIDTQPENEVIFNVLKQLNPQVVIVKPDDVPAPVASLPKGGIVLYCTSWCPACRRARAWFKDHNLSYVEVDIDKNPAGAEQVKQWNRGNRTTPTFDIDGVILTEFNEAKLREILRDRL